MFELLEEFPFVTLVGHGTATNLLHLPYMLTTVMVVEPQMTSLTRLMSGNCYQKVPFKWVFSGNRNMERLSFS